MSLIRWSVARKLAILTVLIYVFVYLIAYLYNIFSVTYQEKVFSAKELSEGPLIMKDIFKQKKGEKILTGVHVLNAVKVFDQPLSDEEFKKLKLSTDSTTIPTIPVQFYKKFTTQAQKLFKKGHDFIYFIFVNGAYDTLTLNWLCNVAVFKGSLERTLIVTTNQTLSDAIKKQWKQVTCIYLDLGSEFEESLEWGRQKYINLLTVRSKLMEALTRKKVPYVLVETDATWLRDPFAFFKNVTLVDDADIVVPVKGYADKKGHRLAFDPMIVFPTKSSIDLFKELTRRLLNESSLYDQDVLDELCRTQYMGVVCREFAWSDVADGKWYKLSENERKSFRPYIVNNNYYVGVINKIARQAINGLWFLTKKGTCTKTKVDKALKRYNSKESKKG